MLLEGLRKGRDDEPVAQNTAFGWILSGKNFDVRPELQSLESRAAFVHHCVTNSDLDSVMERFWNLEEVFQFRVYQKLKKSANYIFSQRILELSKANILSVTHLNPDL